MTRLSDGLARLLGVRDDILDGGLALFDLSISVELVGCGALPLSDLDAQVWPIFGAGIGQPCFEVIDRTLIGNGPADRHRNHERDNENPRPHSSIISSVRW